jgi:hypothetical protein
VKLLEHFSCYTSLPVKLADVADHIIETSPVDRLVRYAVDVDQTILQGMYRQYHHKPPYAQDGEIIGEVIYSKYLDPFDARMVQCKEMLHAYDKNSEMASDQAQVEQLAKDIIVPLGMLIKLQGLPSHQVVSDNGGIFSAIAVLLPRDFLDEIRPLNEQGRVTVAQISQLAQVPSEYVRFALRNDWQDILDTIP